MPDAKIEVHNTTCYMCACRCGIRVHLRNGEVRYIDGNPDHPLNHGVICAKGSAGIMKQYSPARLTRPLRRKPGAERGGHHPVHHDIFASWIFRAGRSSPGSTDWTANSGKAGWASCGRRRTR